MVQKSNDKPGTSKKKSLTALSSPKITRDPSLPYTLATTSKTVQPQIPEEKKEPFRKRCCRYIYNKDKKTICGRSCMSWVYIIAYSIIYLIFLATYTMVFLYGSLMIVKATSDYTEIDKVLLLTYSDRGIGLTATPTSEYLYPLIYYRRNNIADYEKYVRALNALVNTRKNLNLGPCGQSPYGYGDRPCVLLRINRQWKWRGRPLGMNSTLIHSAPVEVREWVRNDSKKLWFHCSGYHSYDREHIGRLNYYPYPPGIDPGRFPLDAGDMSPLIAVQISNFTLGVSLAVECKLWYESGPSSIDFVLYVTEGS